MSDAGRIAADMTERPLAVVDHLAKTIELRHEPPSPMDGVVEGEMLANAMRESQKDTSVRREIISLAVDRDTIVQQSIVTTTGEDQQTRTMAHTGRFRVADGRIVAVLSQYRPVESAGA
jgi:hypothetical protein